MTFLDANIIIYVVERAPDWGAVATWRLFDLMAQSETFVTSDLVRMECLVGPLSTGDSDLYAQITEFFESSVTTVESVSSAACIRAAKIRALKGHKPLDSLHLAVALEVGCSRFLTSDQNLKNFSELFVDLLVLPDPQ